MKNTKKKIIVLVSLTLILLAGIIATSFAAFRTTSNEEIVYEMGSVKIAYTGGESFSYSNLTNGSYVAGVSTLDGEVSLMSIKNFSTVPVKTTVTISLYDYQSQDPIIGERKDLIESLFIANNSSFTKDSSASTDNKLVYTATMNQKKEYQLFTGIMFPDDEDSLINVGSFNISVSAIAEQIEDANSSYQYAASSNTNLTPGAYYENLGAITADDQSNTLDRPMLARERIESDIDFDLNINSNWMEYDGYYYYKNVLSQGDTTAPLIDKLLFPENLGNEYQGMQINLSFDKELIDSDPAVRPNDWPTDQVLGITNNPGATVITISGCPNENLEIGDRVILNASVNNNTISLNDAVWSSSNVSVADVSTTGRVEAISQGDAIITITASNGASATCLVTVNPDTTINVSSLVMSEASKNIEVGENSTLTVTVNPVNATNQNAIWQTSDANVVIVSPVTPNSHTANIVGLREGTATVSATIGGVTTSTQVTVTPAVDTNLVNSMSITPTTITKTVGETGKVTAVINPNTSTATISYQSSNPEVVSVDENGNFEALKVGTAAIVATAGNKTAMANITVNQVDNSNSAVGLSLDVASKNLDLADADNKIFTIVATMLCENQNKACTDKVVYTSDNPLVAVVDSATGLVSATGVGTAIITATAGNITQQVTVTVKNSAPEYDVSSVSLNIGNVSINRLELDLGETTTITAVVTPSTSRSQVTFTSSNPSVATVNQNGVVTAVSAGLTTIVATAGGKYAAIPVMVGSLPGPSGNTNPAANIVVSPLIKDSLDFASHEVIKIQAQAKGSDGNISSDQIVFASSNPNVAIVDQNGNVVPTGVGTTTITMTAGSVSESVSITVYDSNAQKIVNSLSITSSSTVNMNKGNKSAIKVKLDPSDSQAVVSYVSLDSSIATVDQNGNITAVGNGTTYIVVSVGGYIEKVKVNVGVKDNNSTDIVDNSNLNGTNKNWQPGAGKNPYTGDNLVLYIGIGLVSFAIILIIFFITKLNKKEEITKVKSKKNKDGWEL